MKKYGNHSGNSGVIAYEEGPDWIKVKFIDGSVYIYSYKKAGKHHVEQLKILAKAGKGLSGYISKYVKDRYDRVAA